MIGGIASAQIAEILGLVVRMIAGKERSRMASIGASARSREWRANSLGREPADQANERIWFAGRRDHRPPAHPRHHKDGLVRLTRNAD
jgi:hypothetical protein